ncbi:MAG: hypothetical protein ACRD1C_00975 [Terriglobales bacterium]
MRHDPENPLAGLGYTPREAAFLRMVAMHSGVFQRRHFVEFAGAGDGKAVQVLISKLLGRHGQAVAFGENRFLYRLSHKAVYRALGIEDSNNRKGRGPALMKARLMALDLVLTHASARFLETEDAKVQFFTTQFGVAADALPRVDYPSRKVGSSAPCRHWFIEKYPIFLTGAAPGLTVNFSFVDDGQATVSSFANFLRRYNSVLAAARFRLFYVTESTEAAATARRYFDRIWGEAAKVKSGANNDQLRRFFELTNRSWEAETRLNHDEAAELLKLRRLYSGPEYDAFFAKWRAGSLSASHTVVPLGRLPGLGERAPEAAKRFEPVIIGGRYGFLSAVVRAPTHLRSSPSLRAAPPASPDARIPVASQTPTPKGINAQAEPGAEALARKQPGKTHAGKEALARKQPGKTHAGNDPVMTGFGPTGQSSAVRRSPNR